MTYTRILYIHPEFAPIPFKHVWRVEDLMLKNGRLWEFCERALHAKQIFPGELIRIRLDKTLVRNGTFMCGNSKSFNHLVH